MNVEGFLEGYVGIAVSSAVVVAVLGASGLVTGQHLLVCVVGGQGHQEVNLQTKFNISVKKMISSSFDVIFIYI